MKKILLALSLFAMACNNDKDSKKLETTPSSSKEQSKQTDSKPSTTSKQVSTNIKTYTGKMNDKIEVEIQIAIIDDMLVGELVYLNTKDKKPIKVAGSTYEQYTRIVEYDNKGNVTGFFDINNEDGKLMTEWMSPKKETTYSFELKEINKPTKINVNETPTDKIAGTYVYNYGGGARGEVKVNKTKDNEYNISFFSITKTEGNLAMLDDVKVNITSNQFTYTIPDSEGCQFKVLFHDNFVMVSYLSEACAQGYFGHNASIDHQYLKIK